MSWSHHSPCQSLPRLSKASARPDRVKTRSLLINCLGLCFFLVQWCHIHSSCYKNIWLISLGTGFVVLWPTLDNSWWETLCCLTANEPSACKVWINPGQLKQGFLHQSYVNANGKMYVNLWDPGTQSEMHSWKLANEYSNSICTKL